MSNDSEKQRDKVKGVTFSDEPGLEERSAAKELSFPPRSWWRTKKRLNQGMKEIYLSFFNTGLHNEIKFVVLFVLHT